MVLLNTVQYTCYHNLGKKHAFTLKSTALLQSKCSVIKAHMSGQTELSSHTGKILLYSPIYPSACADEPTV